jgi:hypothetical protein
MQLELRDLTAKRGLICFVACAALVFLASTLNNARSHPIIDDSPGRPIQQQVSTSSTSWWAIFTFEDESDRLVRQWAQEAKAKADREEYDRLMLEAYHRSPEYQLKRLSNDISEVKRQLEDEAFDRDMAKLMHR